MLKLSAQAEEELKTTDFSAKDVLVGTVRTAEQLDYCLRTKQYYVPAKFLDNAPFPLDSIALHEEDIGTEPGIRWFGKIYTLELIKRANIPVPMRPGADPNEIYYQYAVESWQLRKPPLPFQEVTGDARLLPTNFYLRIVQKLINFLPLHPKKTIGRYAYWIIFMNCCTLAKRRKLPIS